MSRRENVIKATAGALQAKAHDLTQYRRQSTRDPRRIRLRGEDAAGALAFSALDQFEGQDGRPAPANDESAQRLPGDRMGPLLLRLKYAEQHSKALFDSGRLLLVHRHGGLSGRPSMMVHAVALAALFEWVHDSCPKCRGSKPGRSQERRGMRCLSCNNSGRVSFKPKTRWRLVNEFVSDAQRARGAKVTGVPLQRFQDHWTVPYFRFLDVLRAADRRIAGGLDLGIFASVRNPDQPLDSRISQGTIARTAPEPRATIEASTAEGERGPEGPANGPRELDGVVSPQES